MGAEERRCAEGARKQLEVRAKGEDDHFADSLALSNIESRADLSR
jgi:hypothetical protein